MSSVNRSTNSANTNNNTGGWWSPLVSCCTTDTVDISAYSKEFPRPPPRTTGHHHYSMDNITTDNALQRLDKAVKLVLDDYDTGLLLNEVNPSVIELIASIRILFLHGIHINSSSTLTSSNNNNNNTVSNIEQVWEFLSTVCWTNNLRLLLNESSSSSVNRISPNPLICIGYIRSLLDNNTIPDTSNNLLLNNNTSTESSHGSTILNSSTMNNNTTNRYETALRLFMELCLMCKNISLIFLILCNTSESRISELRANLYDHKAVLRTPGAPERIVATLKLLEKCSFNIELINTNGVTLPKPAWNSLYMDNNDNIPNNYNSITNLSLAGLERTIGGLLNSAVASVGLRNNNENRTKIPWEMNNVSVSQPASGVGSNYATVTGTDATSMLASQNNNRSYATSSVGRMFNSITGGLFSSSSSSSSRNKYAIFGRPLAQLIQDPYACMHAPLDSRLSVPDFIYDCTHIIYNAELVLQLLRSNRTLSNLTPELINKYGYLPTSSLNIYHSNYGRNRWMDDVLFEVNLVPTHKNHTEKGLTDNISTETDIRSPQSSPLSSTNMNVLSFSVDTPTSDTVLAMVRGYEGVGRILSPLSTDNVETLQFTLASSSTASSSDNDNTVPTVPDNEIAIVPTSWIDDSRAALYSILYFLYRLPDPVIPQERFYTALGCSYLPHWDDYSFQLEKQKLNGIGTNVSNENSPITTKTISSAPYPTPLLVNLRALINDLPMPNRILLAVIITLFAKITQIDSAEAEITNTKEVPFVPSSSQRSRASILADVIGMSIIRPCGDCLRAPQPPSNGVLNTPIKIIGDVRIPSHLLSPQDSTHIKLLIETMIISWKYIIQDTISEIRHIETLVRHKTNLLQSTADAIQENISPNNESDHEMLLRRIWKDVIPAVRASTSVEIEMSTFALTSPVWKVLGFRLVDPVPDFITSGFLGLKCLSYIFSAHRNRSLAILARVHGNREVEAAWKALSPVQGEENIPLGTDTYYPVASTALAIVYKLAEKLHFIQIQPVAANLNTTTTISSQLPSNMPHRRSSDTTSVPVLSPNAATATNSGTTASAVKPTVSPPTVTITDHHPHHHHHHHHVFSAATVAMHNPNLWQLCDNDKSVHSVSGVFLDLCSIAFFIFDARWTAMDINENNNDNNRTNINNMMNNTTTVLSSLALSDIPRLINVSVNDTLKLLPWLFMHQTIMNTNTSTSNTNDLSTTTNNSKYNKNYDQPTLDVLGSLSKWRNETGVGLRNINSLINDDKSEWINNDNVPLNTSHAPSIAPSVPQEWMLPIHAPSNSIEEADELYDEGDNVDSTSTDGKKLSRKNTGLDEAASPSLVDTYSLSSKPVTSLPIAYCVHKSGVLSDRQIRMLQAVLPRSLQAGSHQWQLLYSLRTDGANLETLLRRAEGRTLTLLVIRDSYGAIFGAFSANEWNRSGRYYGVPGGWVFTFEPRQREDKIRQRLLLRNEKQNRANRLQMLGESTDNLTNALIAATANATSRNPPSPPSPTSNNTTGTNTQPFHVYRWAKTNRYFQAIELDNRSHVKGLSIGAGHYASIHLDDTLDRGFTGSCATFSSPPLARLPTSNGETITTVGIELAPEEIPENDLSLAHLGSDVHFRAIDVELWGFARRVAGSTNHNNSTVGLNNLLKNPSTGTNSILNPTGTPSSGANIDRPIPGRRSSLPEVKVIPSDI